MRNNMHEVHCMRCGEVGLLHVFSHDGGFVFDYREKVQWIPILSHPIYIQTVRILLNRNC